MCGERERLTICVRADTLLMFTWITACAVLEPACCVCCGRVKRLSGATREASTISNVLIKTITVYVIVETIL